MYHGKMERRGRGRQILLIGLALACARAPTQMYPGAERPRSETAVLRDRTNAEVLEIDGNRASGNSWSFLPGSHELLVRFRIFTSAPGTKWRISTYWSIPIRAVSGETYQTIVRFQKEVAPELQERVEMEFGVLDSSGEWAAKPASCGPKRPRREA